jgi:AraC family transcriptional regulator
MISGAPTQRALFSCRSAPIAVSAFEYPGNYLQRRHTHDEASLTVVLRGGVEETRDRDTDRATALSVLMRPAGVPHADRYAPNGCHTVQIRWRAGLNGEHAFTLPRSPVWHHRGGGALRRFLMLCRQLETPHVLDEDVEHAICELLSLLPGPGRGARQIPAWLVRVKESIDDSPVETRHSLADLAALAACHPVHLTRTFKRWFGTSIRAYLKCRRWKAALALCDRRSLTLTEIAHALGYSDQSHFSRDFRFFTGANPVSYRAFLHRLTPRG